MPVQEPQQRGDAGGGTAYRGNRPEFRERQVWPACHLLKDRRCMRRSYRTALRRQNADEHIDHAIGVAWDQIGGSRGKGDRAPVGRDRRT